LTVAQRVPVRRLQVRCEAAWLCPKQTDLVPDKGQFRPGKRGPKV